MIACDVVRLARHLEAGAMHPLDRGCGHAPQEDALLDVRPGRARLRETKESTRSCGGGVVRLVVGHAQSHGLSPQVVDRLSRRRNLTPSGFLRIRIRKAILGPHAKIPTWDDPQNEEQILVQGAADDRGSRRSPVESGMDARAKRWRSQRWTLDANRRSRPEGSLESCLGVPHHHHPCKSILGNATLFLTSKP